METLAVRIVSDQPQPAVAERLLRELPNWFRIEESLRSYVEDAARLPTYLAYVDGMDEAVGLLLVARHFSESAEVHLMAVSPGVHRRGIGRALLTAAERDLHADGARFVQVKTQGLSRRDEGYAKTLAFYRAQGFVSLEEIHGLWPENPCLILMKVLSTPD